MAWIQQIWQPAQGTQPGFRSHLKHPLPELPRIAIGAWALSLFVLVALTRDVPVSMLLWLLAGLGLSFMTWLNPWPVLAMRVRRDVASAVGDLLGMTIVSLLAFPMLVFMLPDQAMDFRGRILVGELLQQSASERAQIAEQLVAHQVIAPRQMQLPTSSGEQAWMGVESDGRMWLYRSDVRGLIWLTPKQTPDGIRWHCQGLGVQAHLNATCRANEAL